MAEDIHLPEDTLFCCEACGTILPSLQEVNAQQNAIIEYVCNFCSKQFDLQETVKSHIVAVHRKHLINVQELDVLRYGWAKEVRIFPCPYCSRGCSTKHNLEQHIRTHTGAQDTSDNGLLSSNSQKIVCHLCPVENRMTFTRRNALTKHIAAHHPPPTANPNIDNISHKTQNSTRSTLDDLIPNHCKANSNAPLMSGFTVAEGAEICSPSHDVTSNRTEVASDQAEGVTASDADQQSSIQTMASTDNLLPEDDGDGTDPILNCFIIQDTTGRYTCTLCEKKFQDKAILRKHLLTKHLVQGPEYTSSDCSQDSGVGNPPQNCEVIYLATSSDALNGTDSSAHHFTDGSTAVVVDPSQLQALGATGEVLVDNQGSLGMTNMYILQDGQTGYVLGGTQLVDENGHVMSVDVEEEIVLSSSADVVVGGQSDLGGRNADEVDTRTANQLFMQFPSSKELDDGFADIENRIAVQDGSPPHKMRRYQCPDCNRSFKKFAKLQIHIQNTHPEVYAAAEIQSCETDLVTQVENMTSAEESRESGLVTSRRQHLNSHSHLAAEEVVVDAYSHQLDSRAVEGTNSSNAILNHVNAIGRRADLEDAIIIHDPKNDATSEFYQMEIITSGDVDAVTSGTVISGHGVGMGVGGVIQVPKSPSSPTVEVGASPSAVTISTVNYYAVSSERPFLCQECGKAYKTRSHLTQHIRYHTGEKPFKCDICGSSFHLSGDRNRHVIKMHSDYRPHKCPYCPKGFVDRYALTNHLKFHSGESTFKCEYCTETFLSKAQMKQHRITHFF